MKKILRTPAAAEYVGLRPPTLEKLRVRGEGPQFVRLGTRTIGYDIADLDSWLEARKVTSTSEPARSKTDMTTRRAVQALEETAGP